MPALVLALACGCAMAIACGCAMALACRCAMALACGCAMALACGCAMALACSRSRLTCTLYYAFGVRVCVVKPVRMSNCACVHVCICVR